MPGARLLDRLGPFDALLKSALHGAEDGELFLESRRTEKLVFENGTLKTASFDSDEGFGLRAVAGEATAYASAGELSAAAFARAADTVRAVRHGYTGHVSLPPPGTNRRLYGDADPTELALLAGKVSLLAETDAHIRSKDPRVREVTIAVEASQQTIEIIRPDGFVARDVRPLVKVNITVVAERGALREVGSFGFGGRRAFAELVTPAACRDAAEEALRLALVALHAGPAPAGEQSVVLGPGWPGILLHEAVGHGLEGDAHRKKSSVFATMMGERIAAEGVTVVDDGTLPDMRGSITMDDEGTPSGRTVLIEDGRLVGLMQDRQSGRLMGAGSTGNGRRQTYAHQPMPRMTNTFMLGGEADPADVLASVQTGLYAVSFGGGQVDIASGKFVFTCTEAYRIENGRVGRPVKGAVLIGNGADALTRIRMIGNDMALDPGIGLCGKFGQLVPVGVGQPTLRIDGLTVGGTG
jgi:TldD protein